MSDRAKTLGTLLALCVLAGCGGVTPTSDYSQVKLLPVTGTVTLDQKPLASAVVTFEADDGQFSFGMTDSSGRFQLKFDSQTTGVTADKKKVRISTTRKILGLNSEEEGGGEGERGEGAAPAAKPQELVPAKYNRQSELTVEVSPNKTHFDFPLVSK